MNNSSTTTTPSSDNKLAQLIQPLCLVNPLASMPEFLSQSVLFKALTSAVPRKNDDAVAAPGSHLVVGIGFGPVNGDPAECIDLEYPATNSMESSGAAWDRIHTAFVAHVLDEQLVEAGLSQSGASSNSVNSEAMLHRCTSASAALCAEVVGMSASVIQKIQQSPIFNVGAETSSSNYLGAFLRILKSFLTSQGITAHVASSRFDLAASGADAVNGHANGYSVRHDVSVIPAPGQSLAVAETLFKACVAATEALFVYTGLAHVLGDTTNDHATATARVMGERHRRMESLRQMM